MRRLRREGNTPSAEAAAVYIGTTWTKIFRSQAFLQASATGPAPDQAPSRKHPDQRLNAVSHETRKVEEEELTGRKATVEVFMAAIKGLPRAGRQELIRRMLADREFRRDLIDMALIESRRSEPARPFREYLKTASRRAS
jgi:hypothetical protein